ncbi:MAG: hypothetical protein ACOX2M_03910 [Fastidiosipilaceae bacterium]|jgi:hypothetical protein
MIIEPTKHIKELAKNFYVFRDREKQSHHLKLADDGHDSEEFYSLDYTLSLLLYSFIKGFQQRAIGYPDSLSSLEEWYTILGDMAEGFKTYYTASEMGEVWSEEDRIKVDLGFELFGEWFGALWI